MQSALKLRAVLVLSAACSSAHETKQAPVANKSATWVRQLGDENDQGVRGVAIDDEGNSIAVGYTSRPVHGGDGTIDFGDGKAQPVIGDTSMFVAKYTKDGSLLWARLFGNAANGGIAISTAVAILPSGNILVGGTAHAPIDFGGGPISFSSSGKVMVLLELKPDGTTVAAHLYGDPSHGEGGADATAITIAPDGDWLVAGTGFRSVDLGTGPVAKIGFAPFVARYAPDGKARWVRYASADSQFEASASAIALGGSGEVYACGRTDGSGLDGHPSAFVEQLDGKTGEVRWTTVVGTRCLALATLGDTVVAGGLFEDGALVAFGPGGMARWSVRGEAAGLFHEVDTLNVDGDAVIAGGLASDHSLTFARIDAKGTVLASKQYPADVLPHGAALGPHVIVVGGELRGGNGRTTDFGTGSLSPVKPRTPGTNMPDGFVLHLSSPW